MFSACVRSWSLVSYHAPVRRWRASPLLIHFWQLKVQKFKGLQLDSLNNVLFTFDCLVLHTESSFFKIPEFQSNLWTPRVMISLWYVTRRKKLWLKITMSFRTFFSGVRDWYNDLNGATLTGAIDVIVVEQEDGTFVSSPFHVRFGKLGLLKARDKVVSL